MVCLVLLDSLSMLLGLSIILNLVIDFRQKCPAVFHDKVSHLFLYLNCNTVLLFEHFDKKILLFWSILSFPSKRKGVFTKKKILDPLCAFEMSMK